MAKGSMEGWMMVSISSFSCVLGASIVVLLGNKKLISSPTFLSASMSLGGGVLIFNSLYTLLPASQQKLNSNFYTYLCFFIGVVFTLILTLAIQACTPRALHTCDPIGSVAHHLKDHQHHTPTIEYGTIPNTTITIATTTTVDTEETKNDYFLIGIQTAIAICIHKFPEGLIMFVSNQSSSELGLSVAAAIIIHNFIEGFLIALPLYYATNSRVSAFGYASFLGGMSQPLGAILGLCVIRNVDTAKEQLLFGIIFGVVSGMMCLIAIQSMLPQAIRADATHRCVPLFFFIGIFLVGLSSLLHSM